MAPDINVNAKPGDRVLVTVAGYDAPFTVSIPNIQKGSQLETIASAPVISVSGKPIEDRGTDWHLEGVKICNGFENGRLRHGMYVIDFSKQLAPARTQDEHAKMSDGYVPATGPDFYGIGSFIRGLLKDRKFRSLAKDALTTLKSFFAPSAPCLGFDSRWTWTPEGQLENVVHNYKQRDEFAIEGDFVGPDGFVSELGKHAKAYLQAGFGTNNLPGKINKTITAVSGGPAYVLRFNEKPNDQQERVLVLGIYNIGRCDINSFGDVNDYWPALRVRRAEQKISP